MTQSQARDRDAGGRPRNARPRDALGRPLPYGADGVAPIPEDLSLTSDQTLVRSQELLDAGLAFQAHEVLESRWKAAPQPEREVWRGLAQLAVGITHVQRGNQVGARELLLRAADRLDSAAAGHLPQVSAADLAAWARELVARIERSGTGDVPPAELMPPMH